MKCCKMCHYKLYSKTSGTLSIIKLDEILQEQSSRGFGNRNDIFLHFLNMHI